MSRHGKKKTLHPICYQYVMSDGYVTCMSWRGQKNVSQFNGRHNVWQKKTTDISLPNVTSWQKKNVTPYLLQLCDECMEERSQLIMHAN